MLCITARRALDVRIEPSPIPVPNVEKRSAGEDETRLEETDGLAHRGLDVQRLDVLPVLLQEGDEEVDA